jgi:hypothetical protein
LTGKLSIPVQHSASKGDWAAAQKNQPPKTRSSQSPFGQCPVLKPETRSKGGKEGGFKPILQIIIRNRLFEGKQKIINLLP